MKRCPNCLNSFLTLLHHGKINDYYQCDNCQIIWSKEVTTPKKVNFTRDMALKNLKIRSELFNRIPSLANMLMSFEITDAVILQTYKLGGLDMSLKGTEKSLERYEKCKNLALGNVNFNERKLAYNRTLEIFYRVIGEEEKPEENKNGN